MLVDLAALDSDAALRRRLCYYAGAGYDLIPEVIKVAQKNAVAGGDKFRQVESMKEAFKGLQP